jgi:hypothetical protein
MSGSGAGGFSKSLICLVERPDKAPSTDGLAVTVEDVGEALIAGAVDGPCEEVDVDGAGLGRERNESMSCWPGASASAFRLPLPSLPLSMVTSDVIVRTALSELFFFFFGW